MMGRRLWLGVVLVASLPLTSALADSKEIDVMTTTGIRASRLPPKRIDPVVIDGIQYAQCAGDLAVHGQMGGFLGAFDAAGQLLWSMKVYDNVRRPGLEGDVQDVFFSAMAVEPEGRLRITNERGDTFIVDVKSRTVITVLPRPKPLDDEWSISPPSR